MYMYSPIGTSDWPSKTPGQTAASSPEIGPRVLHILSLKRFTLSCRFENSKFSVTSTGICTKYWLTAYLMLAQCS